MPLPDPLILPSCPDHVVQNIIEGDVRPHDKELQFVCCACAAGRSSSPAEPVEVGWSVWFHSTDFSHVPGVRQYKSGCGVCGRFHRRQTRHDWAWA